MTLIQLTVLAIVQGITEFLPISSSAHLILVPEFTDWPDQGILIDVAVHVGSLVAVIVWLWRDILDMMAGLVDWRQKGLMAHPGRKMIAWLIVATIPVIVAGLALKMVGLDTFRSLAVIGWAMLGFGVLLWIVDALCVRIGRVDDLSWGDIVVLGLSQVLALIPGTSRAGITMTAGRLLGMQRDEAARFSMLMSIPTIIAAGALATLEAKEQGLLGTIGVDAAIAAGMSAIAAYIAIKLMMNWLKTASFLPFILYRIALGGFLIYLSQIATA